MSVTDFADKVEGGIERRGRAALARLMAIAQRDTGQSRRVADFLLAWYNAEENGGWDPTSMWGLDEEIRTDVIMVLVMVSTLPRYPDSYPEGKQIAEVWRRWRGAK